MAGSHLEVYSLLNLIGILIVFAIYGTLSFRDRKNLGYYFVPLWWALNAFIFYAVYLVFWKSISDRTFDIWASIIDLQALILAIVVGLSFLWTRTIYRKQ